MYKRPLLFFTCIYTLGILGGSFSNPAISVILLSLILISLIAYSCTRVKAYLILGLSIFVFLFGSIYTAHRTSYFNNNLKAFENQTVLFDAQVISQPDIREGRTNYIIKVNKILSGGQFVSLDSQVLLTIYDTGRINKTYRYGDLISGKGKVHLPSSARNPGSFDYKRYLMSQNVYSTISASDAGIKYRGQAKFNWFIGTSLYLRNCIIRICDNSLPDEPSGLLKGMLIGERNGLSLQTEQDFNISGLTHIICVSGANIAFITLVCIFIFKLFKFDELLTNALAILVIILFVYMTGCSPSVVRAAVMGIMVLIAPLLDRKSDSLTSAAAASLLILLHNPLTLYDVGFQLSFAGVLGIILFYGNLGSLFRFLPKVLKEVLAVSIAVQLTVNPLIALYFNKLPIASLISNILVVPLTGTVTVTGFIMSILGLIHPILSQIAGGLNYFLLSFILWIAHILSSIPFSVITVITPSISLVILYYIMLYVIFKYIPQRKPGLGFYKAFYAFAGMLIIIVCIFSIIPRPLRITFLDIGQGDSCFIKTRSGRTILVDGGGTYPGSTIEENPDLTLIPYVLDNGTKTIDLAILSHAHGDHMEGLQSAVEILKVKRLAIGPQFEANAELNRLVNTCKLKQTQIIQLSKGDEIELDGLKLEVLHPSLSNHFDNESALNNNSLVFKLIWNNTSVLFTGDIESSAENEICRQGINIDSDIIKIPHHGSPSSTSSSFLDLVSPSVSIISVGRNNYGHPSPEVIKRIEQSGSRMYRTDQNGGIRVTVYKNSFKVTPSLN